LLVRYMFEILKKTEKQLREIEFRYLPQIFFLGFEDSLYSLQDMHKDIIIGMSAIFSPSQKCPETYLDGILSKTLKKCFIS
jgi:hypothetical protein